MVLLLAVLVPTACVLWFMNAAMKNERLAVRQRLTDVYREQLSAASDAFDKFWGEKLTRVETVSDLSPAETFAQLVRSGIADSALVFARPDSPDVPGYPWPREPIPSDAETPSSWLEAERLEHELSQPLEAARAYAKIAEQAKETNIRALALQARMRCLAKGGRGDQALGVLAGAMAKAEYRNATDANGRLIVPSCQLLALEVMRDPQKVEFRNLAEKLIQRINDYGKTALPSGQRRFLMQALQSYWPGKQLSPLFPIFPTQAAENLAWECLEAPSWTPPNPGVLSRAKFPDTWHMGSADGRVALILRQDRLIDDLVSAGNLNEPLAGITVRLLQPGRPGSDNEAFLETSASEHMPGWDLAVYLDQDPFAAAARQQNAAYLWIGSLGIATIAILAAIVARYVSRQMKLTRLKNDLIATVSHELKTPLASMRVLVDTLLEGRCRDQRQAQEYFRLIGKENERLSRLIDNFLTFSRMERNKKAFEFSPVNVNEIVTTAEDCIRDRFSGPDCRLDCDLEANLPAVSADRDAMVTVILNLLDNAWKYSGDKKHVRVRTYWADGKVCVAVSDNGTGMSRTVAKKIFNRFYQVDQTLSRKAGGCGLGLSIVKFIIDAHGGTIDVTTHPGEGSTFTVQLPVHSARG